MSKTPKLRFKEFSGDWEQKKLGDECNFFSGGTPLTTNRSYYDGNIPFIRSAELSEYTTELKISQDGLNNSSAKLVQKGDLLYALYGATSGAVSISKIDGAINQAILCIKSDNINLEFLEKILIKNKENIIKTYLQGGQGNLSSNIIKGLKYNLPSKEEQEKIASFLSLIDDKISLQGEKVEALKDYKKGMMQKIFSRKLRFKDDDGRDYPEWEEKKLNEILLERKEKNNGNLRVCSVAVRKGVIDQIEHLGRSFAAKDTSNYNLVKYGDIIYTKSPTGDFPYGIIKQSFLNENVVVSPLYGVFKPLNFNLGYILHCYFYYRENTNNYLYSIIQKGAKNTINITNTTFLSKSLILPIDENEQMKIAKLFIELDNKINKEQEKLDYLNEYKKGLLQQMFV